MCQRYRFRGWQAFYSLGSQHVSMLDGVLEDCLADQRLRLQVRLLAIDRQVLELFHNFHNGSWGLGIPNISGVKRPNLSGDTRLRKNRTLELQDVLQQKLLQFLYPCHRESLSYRFSLVRCRPHLRWKRFQHFHQEAGLLAVLGGCIFSRSLSLVDHEQDSQKWHQIHIP